MPKVQKVSLTITVTDVDGVTHEHCTIEHNTADHVTQMLYKNMRNQREAEEYTRATLRAALFSVEKSLAGDPAIECINLPKNTH